ncbi:MAG: sulfate adenylyltransferase subunit CysN [Gemmatimonadales bacterium]|nr:MAG: sulfate adenylyltransferase subunit CysN [Gemmatimonadales bacterium]
MDLLRFTTAGSVDDGKSTLIGRLLHDSRAIFEDQLDAIEEATRRRGDTGLDLSLLTDGLRAEREQGITIDVAYRYFATPRRKFIIADTPGHVQYTRNMVTGASTADLAVILMDARKGVLTQGKRHGFIASLLRIPRVVVAVNKMDLVGYSEGVYREIVREYTEFSAKLDIHDITFIPLSALRGDNVVDRSRRMPWYNGVTLLHHLENVSISADRNLVDFRFPVQTVIRPHQDFRGYAGTVVSGTVQPGEEIVVLPTGRTSRVERIVTADGDLERAESGDAVVLTIADDVDVGRGDMIVRKKNVPQVGTRIDAMLCWMDEEVLDRSRHYHLQHTTQFVQAHVERLEYRIDVDTLHREQADTLGLNDIGRVRIETARPIFFDSYAANGATGAFILVDPRSNRTVAGGMIRGAVRDDVVEQGSEHPGVEEARTSPNVRWEGWNVDLAERESRNGHRAAVVWLTGLSGSGKSTIAREVERRLFEAGCQTMLLDGDHVRHGLCGDLGFTREDRTENIRRAGELARLFFHQGCITLCTFISPYREGRDSVRAILPEGRFFEVFVEVDVATARARDPKGLYAKALRGEIDNLTGVSAPYEAPEAPDLRLRTAELSVEEAVDRVLTGLAERGILPTPPGGPLVPPRGSAPRG